MPLQEIYYIAEMVVGVAVIISIVFVAIELRQNTYITRKSMADQRSARLNWALETICTDADFRQFQRRIDIDYDNFDEDERYRAWALGMRSLTSMLDELVAYFDGQISGTEFISLKKNMDYAARRPNVQAAYKFLKTGYPKTVQDYWEALDSKRQATFTEEARGA